MAKKNNGIVKKKTTLKNFKEYILELLSESDNKDITLVSGRNTKPYEWLGTI